MPFPGWVLEVVRYTPGIGREHMGYMDKVFKTRTEAAAYYNLHNPHMRPLNAHKTWRSDWDPAQTLARQYIVRRDHGICRTVPPFEGC